MLLLDYKSKALIRVEHPSLMFTIYYRSLQSICLRKSGYNCTISKIHTNRNSIMRFSYSSLKLSENRFHLALLVTKPIGPPP